MNFSASLLNATFVTRCMKNGLIKEITIKKSLIVTVVENPVTNEIAAIKMCIPGVHEYSFA
jgi:hypothetical protein